MPDAQDITRIIIGLIAALVITLNDKLHLNLTPDQQRMIVQLATVIIGVHGAADMLDQWLNGRKVAAPPSSPPQQAASPVPPQPPAGPTTTN